LAADRQTSAAGSSLGGCARVLNARRSRPEAGALPRWSVEKLRRATRRFVLDGLADPNLLLREGSAR